MASDVENLTRFYANLPSIFATDSANLIESSSNTTMTLIDSEKTYQPMFGSFLFADSEPFTRAAFVASTSSSIEMKSTDEEQTDEASTLKANTIPTEESSPLASAEDIDDMENDNDDEDDFDGIPIRHASSTIKEKLNGDNQSEHNQLLDQFVYRIENEAEHDDNDDEEDLFLNGFTDEQHQEHDSTTIPSLFNNIPDIDDLNEHEDDDDDDDRIPFDHMDMLDQSDSIRSSSPDSVLSSSHLRDDDYDDEDEDMNNNEDEDDVTQWNDDDLLRKTTSRNDRPNAPLPPPMVLNIHSDDQVNFIDSSRSNSRCSNASSQLSVGYADQARIFINDDDGLVTSSDSESDHEHDDIIHLEDEKFTRDNSDEEPSLQVNLDYHRSRSSSHSSSNRSDSPRLISSPIPDQSPIVAIDEDINECKKDIPSAPIANVDEDDEDLPIFTSDQPVLSPMPFKNYFEIRNENRQNEIIRDIVNIRHLLDEHDNDDEFLAVMHNPTVFEGVLYDHDDEQKSASIKQTNHGPNTSSQLSMKSESFEHCQNIQQTSLNEKNSSSDITITTYHSSPTAVNHLPIEIEKEENVDVVNRSCIKLKKTQQSPDKNTAKINIKQITNGEEEQQDHYQMMSSDDESDNDSELLQTLAQLHGLVHTPRLSTEIIRTEIFQNENQQQTEEKTNHLISNLNLDEKQNILLSNDDDNNHQRNEEKKSSSTFFSLTSLTSSALFNDDESHSTDLILDSDASSLLIMSNSDYNNPILSSNLLTHNDLPITKKELTESSVLSSFDIEALPIVEELVSDTLQSALAEINEFPSQLVEYFVEQILSEAIYEIYTEDNHSNESKLDDNLSTENLASIIDWHLQTDKQLLDPFDQQFHNIWISHFQTPDDNITENNIDSSSFYSNAFDQSNQANFLPKEVVPSSLSINPFDPVIMDNDLMKDSLTTSVKSPKLFKTDPSLTTDEQMNLSSTENQEIPEMRSTISVNENTETNIPSDDNKPKKRESFFDNQSRLSQFEAFASDHPLNTPDFESIVAEIDHQFDQSSQVRKSTNDDGDEPWELEENSEENLKPVPTNITQKHDLYNNYLPDDMISPVAPRLQTRTNEESENEEDNVDKENENYDSYFTNYQTTENTEPIESSASKTVRFSEKLQDVAVITPKTSLNLTESSTTTSDTDETDDDDDDDNEKATPNLQTNNDQITEDGRNDYVQREISMRNITPRPLSNISLTESEDLPPPLPPLPPLNNKPTTTIDNIPLKSTVTSPSSHLDFKHKINLHSHSDHSSTIQTTANTGFHGNTDSAILRSLSKDHSNADSDEVNDVIACTIDNNQVNIDAKTISPFKCVIGSAGQINEENQTAIITLYGCWLPDHRLREYRYIMDQLFYYVYHKLEKLVTNDYVLVYFHGATPKHRTPELKFLRKCYQMINFRLRKNLRAVYVVHPTRWLRTVIALSRPFFSNKFYHKVHYIFTIAELERQFPDNHISIPVIIEQTDWLYSQKYDRQNASIKRSIERSASRLVSGIEDESAA